MMKFSFIIGTLNRPQELKYCIESLLAQTYAEYEIIIVDQSADNLTEKMVESFNESNGLQGATSGIKKQVV